MDINRPDRDFSRAGRVSILLVLLLVASPLAMARNAAFSQSSPATKDNYALIYGTVWGPDNHPAAGIAIKIRRTGDKKAKWELVSDRSGEFAQRVLPGQEDYIVQADIKTPKDQQKPEIKVHIEDNERQDVAIHLTK